MANFNKSYVRVAQAEGGYQAFPEDRGNYNSLGQLVGTNWGINAQVYEDWIGRPPTMTDMSNMKKSTAKEIYKTNYWNRIQGDLIDNQFVADIFFDGHVNHGNTGIRLMQEILGLPEDAIVGPNTLGAINSGNPATVYNAYKDTRIKFYNFLVVRTPSFAIFLDGWLKRINSFRDFPSTPTTQEPVVADNEPVVNNGNSNKGIVYLVGAGILGTIAYFVIK